MTSKLARVTNLFFDDLVRHEEEMLTLDSDVLMDYVEAASIEKFGVGLWNKDEEVSEARIEQIVLYALLEAHKRMITRLTDRLLEVIIVRLPDPELHVG